MVYEIITIKYLRVNYPDKLTSFQLQNYAFRLSIKIHYNERNTLIKILNQ